MKKAGKIQGFLGKPKVGRAAAAAASVPEANQGT
jgi:hypothetical protein